MASSAFVEEREEVYMTSLDRQIIRMCLAEIRSYLHFVVDYTEGDNHDVKNMITGALATISDYLLDDDIQNARVYIKALIIEIENRMVAITNAMRRGVLDDTTKDIRFYYVNMVSYLHILLKFISSGEYGDDQANISIEFIDVRLYYPFLNKSGISFNYYLKDTVVPFLQMVYKPRYDAAEYLTEEEIETFEGFYKEAERRGYGESGSFLKSMVMRCKAALNVRVSSAHQEHGNDEDPMDIYG